MSLIAAFKNRIFFVLGALSVAWFGSHGLALGQTWTATSSPTEGWSAIASSADGTKLVAVAQYQPIWTSPDSGITWTTNISPAGHWTSVTSSADGNKLVAVMGTGGGGSIYTSTNSGSTWLSNDVPSVTWQAVASSADGNKLLAVSTSGDMPGLVLTSTNAGANWTPRSAAGGFHYFISAASSADGKKLIIGGYVGNIYTSTNYGVTWRSNDLHSASFQGVASSADGNHLVTVVASTSTGDGIFVSTNAGATWSSVYPIKGWFSVASSADGTKLVAGNGYLLTSTNSGATWISNSVPPHTFYYFVGSSADGNQQLAVAPGGPVYTSYLPPTPKLDIVPSADGSMVLSWLIPSSHFDLQRNSDLKTTNWITVTNLPVLNLTNLHQEVVLPPPTGHGFYRLASP